MLTLTAIPRHLVHNAARLSIDTLLLREALANISHPFTDLKFAN
jgi:hypothetical protein